MYVLGDFFLVASSEYKIVKSVLFMSLHSQPFLPGDSHLSHGLREVGGDGSEAPSSTVHNVVAAGTHRGTGAGRQAAGLNEGTAAVA